MQRSQDVESEALAKVDGNIGAVKELRESRAYDARGRHGAAAAAGGRMGRAGRPRLCGVCAGDNVRARLVVHILKAMFRSLH